MKSKSLFSLLLIALAFLIYFGILNNTFVYDDITLITDNPYISELSNITTHLFDSGYFTVTGSATYRPVAEFSYFFMYFLAGNNPLPYHLFSILLHAANGILLFLLISEISRNRKLSISAALLFICYPAYSEAVILITYNDDLLSFLFFLLSLLLYISGRRSFILLSFLTFILALLSKEMAITLPVIVILYDLLLNERFQPGRLEERIKNILQSRIVYYTGFLMITFLYIYLRFFYPPFTSPKIESAETASGLLQRIAYIPYQYFQFLKISFFPVVLNADIIHAYPENFYNIENVISLVVFIFMLFFAIRFYKKYTLVSFGVFWYLITLLPIINIIPHNHPIAERYLYMSSVGYLLILSWIIFKVVPEIKFSERVPILNSRILLLLLILILYSSRTISRTNDWQDPETIWSKTLIHSPDSYRAHNNLGLAYYNKKEFDKAIAHFEQALELTQSREEIYANLGNAYLGQQKTKPAIENYKKALELDPGMIKIHYNLGVAFAIKGDLNSAILQWQKILEIDPENKEAKENIQKARQMMRR